MNILSGILYNKIEQGESGNTDWKNRGENHDRLRRTKEHGGAYLIPRGSVHERMTCDCIKPGLILHHTILLLNKELRKDNITEVGVLCLRNLYIHLKPIIIKFKRYLWVIMMYIRHGQMHHLIFTNNLQFFQSAQF